MNQKPDVVLIVLDTHRADRLGCYGYQRNTSPNLDTFSQSSTVFEKAISPAQWTIPSHASLFTGEYPATHHTIQAGDALSDNFQTLAEYLLHEGYTTMGFCNNPLVGVLNNGFRRGFQHFYNYGGTIPSRPSNNGHNSTSILSKIRGQYLKIIDHIATPIQQTVAASPQVLQIALNPWLVPLWTRYSNFKGDTPASIQDTSQHLASIRGQKSASPQFIFLNLMGTHLPYAPPRRFVHKFAPIVLDDPNAQEFIRVYNTRALHWLLPLEHPYPPMEAQAINDMYDAEVAYQDYLLNQLLTTLGQPAYLDTMVIIVGDHGEMLGEHQIMGHGLGVHEELVHVPLIVRFPGQLVGKRVKEVVSTTRIFHTILDVIGLDTFETPYGEIVSTAETSLYNLVTSPEFVFSEAYPPNNLIVIMKKYAPGLIDRFNCRATQWAVYNQPYKLVRTENVKDDFYNYIVDPKEKNILLLDGFHSQKLIEELVGFLKIANAKGQEHPQGFTSNLEDERVMERLRNLGYIE